MNTGMRPDLFRLLLVLGIAIVAGIVVGRIFLCAAIGLLLVIAWYSRSMAGLLKFIRQDSEEDLVEMPGIMEELTRSVDQLRNDSRQREQLLNNIIVRYEETTTALPDAVVVTSEEGGIEWANERAGEYLGVTWPTDRGQRLSNLIRSPELQLYLQQQKDRATQEVLVMVSPEDQDLSIEIRVIRYGNSYMLLVARDITEFQRINVVRKDFVANASHELRTPLTVIAGYLETFEEDADCPAGWQPKIAQMREQCRRMQRLITDLLELSRLESARKAERVVEVNVTGIIEAIIREAEILSGSQRHVFVKALDPGLYLMGDQHDLYQAFSNLVFNAVQYTAAGGRISLRWYRDQAGAHFVVEDTGEGIEKVHLSRVTERFYRVDKGRSRSRGGTGLGLAIVKHVLSRFGASLHIESKVGKGSLFRCDFPSGIVHQVPDQNIGTA